MAKRWIDTSNPERFLGYHTNSQQLARLARELKCHNPNRRPYGHQLFALNKSYMQHEKKLKKLEDRLWREGKDMSPTDKMEQIRARGGTNNHQAKITG